MQHDQVSFRLQVTDPATLKDIEALLVTYGFVPVRAVCHQSHSIIYLRDHSLFCLCCGLWIPKETWKAYAGYCPHCHGGHCEQFVDIVEFLSAHNRLGRILQRVL
jgi:Zn finger protein HypA/HybF involved in hydrogenase expression